MTNSIASSATATLLAATRTKARGPEGRLPITADMLLAEPSGNLFGMTQDAGMGWNPAEVNRAQVLIVSTQGGLARATDVRSRSATTPGTGRSGCSCAPRPRRCATPASCPFAAYVSDPCDGRTQGTGGMFDSLPYRNDAAITMRRLIRSLPRRAGVIGIATCDKGLPATMLALAGTRRPARHRRPGGVTLPAIGGEDAGKVQSIGARFAHGLISVDDAATHGMPRVRHAGRRLPVPGDSGDLAGRRRSVRHDAAAQRARPVGRAGVAGHGAPFGLALVRIVGGGMPLSAILTQRALENAMLVTRRSADRRTCCCTSPRSRTRPGCAGRPSTTGRGSTE